VPHLEQRSCASSAAQLAQHCMQEKNFLEELETIFIVVMKIIRPA
jgi:hypothetical protein